ncbi:lipopolysaccharide assembly protein LapA domain-containing protein [Psychrobacter sp. I-STPA6b]|uniref:lipopolysaccharide assembly protein LapA domain-containing protein n=1 Tax=Psychrobacter sp. I-STPA6b TaxID=2585718 RepID=UPI001D0C5CB6|nr:lipopolysaccharide assembly protein LapA domain-containing protein [Psychrobacter sp. I-STPA6b]
MRVILMVILFLIFGYSLGLVLVNNDEVAVNLLFTQSPSMNLGLLLIICLGLGVLIGLLLALLLFKVLQNKWEIGRLNKENRSLKEELRQANIAIDRQANSPSVDQSVFVGDKDKVTPAPTSPVNNNLTKH